MSHVSVQTAFETLRGRYTAYDWQYGKVLAEEGGGLMLEWPGGDDEAVIVVMHHSDGTDEPFHYHNYFYFNFAYRNSFDTQGNDRERITVEEGMLHGGQPFSGHAMLAHDNEETIIIGVLVKQEMMHERILPLLSPSLRLLSFLVQPQTDARAHASIHLAIREQAQMRHLLELMALEYLRDGADSQEMLSVLATAFLTLISRELADGGSWPGDPAASRTAPIIDFIRQNPARATLSSTAQHFGYNPVYLSSLLKTETGRTFSQHLMTERMHRAQLLLQGTDLPIEKISQLVGYASPSSFYRAHSQFFGCPPRQHPPPA